MKNEGSINKNSYLEKFRFLKNNLSIFIETSKQEYFSKIAKKLLILILVHKRTGLF